MNDMRPKPLMRWCSFVVLTVFLFLGSVQAQSTSFQWRKEPNGVFDVGESIIYVIKYGFIHAGHATIQVRETQTINGRPAYYIISKAYSNNAMDLVFKVRDKNETWVDAESLCSVRYYQRIREGLYRRESRTDYDHPNTHFVHVKKRKGKESVIEGGIPPFVQDVLSSLYYIRTRDLRVGEDYSFDANSGGKTWPLTVHVQKIQKIRVPAGKFECLKLDPILAGEGIFQHEGRLEVWVTNDARRIPVLLRSRVMVGAFDAEMKEYSTGEMLPSLKEADTKVKEKEPGELGVGDDLPEEKSGTSSDADPMKIDVK